MLFGRRLPTTMLGGLTALFAAGLGIHSPLWAIAGLIAAGWCLLTWRYSSHLPLVIYWLFVSLNRTMMLPTEALPLYWGLVACCGWLYLSNKEYQ